MGRRRRRYELAGKNARMDKLTDWLNKDLNQDKISYYIDKRNNKDGRSKNITKTDIEHFKEDLYRDTMAIFRNNKNISFKEAYKKALNSSRFTSYREVATTNMQNTLKLFGFNVKINNLKYDATQQMYAIIGGQYAGSYVEIVPNPGHEPSYSIVLVDVNGVAISEFNNHAIDILEKLKQNGDIQLA